MNSSTLEPAGFSYIDGLSDDEISLELQISDSQGNNFTGEKRDFTFPETEGNYFRVCGIANDLWKSGKLEFDGEGHPHFNGIYINIPFDSNNGFRMSNSF